MGKEDFLKLLVTQLTQQDPLNPADGAEFVAQLAQFTSLERLVNMERALADVALATMANANALAAGYIGKGVVANGNSFEFEVGDVEKLGFDLGADAQVKIEVKNAEGVMVDTIHIEGSKGDNTFEWKGIKKLGERGEVVEYEAEGEYTFTVTATGADDKSVTVSTQVVSHVTSVKFIDRIPYLVLANGDTVTMADIYAFVEKE